MKQSIKDVSKLLTVLFFLLWISFTINLIEKKNEIIYANTETVKVETKYQDRPVPYIITETLPEDYNHRKEMIQMYLRSLGESEEEIATWDRIIYAESRYDPSSQAPTYWSQCSDGRFIELKQYESGGYWQADCSDYGLTAIETGYSSGLFHIIAPTWRTSCPDIKNNSWIDEATCARIIKEKYGFNQWSSY